MRSIITFVLAVVSIPALCFGEKGSSGDPMGVLRGGTNLPNLVLALASIDVPPLRCLTADLTSIDEDAGEVIYTWHVKSPNSSERTDFRFTYVLTGPDTFVSHINNDTRHTFVTRLLYSDYKNCIVDQVLVGEKEVCYLWESKETAYDVPKNCLDAYKKSCGDCVTLYSKDACNAN